MLFMFFVALTMIGCTHGCNCDRLQKDVFRCQEKLKNAEKVQSIAPIPAFSATVGKDTRFAPGTKYIFDNVLVNVNGMYDKRTGIAVIPSSGNYVITWHALANGGYWDFPYLKVNGNIKGIAGCHSSTRNVRSSCGNSLIIPLQKGDRIWIEEWTGGKSRTDVQGGFSSFSVHKL